MRVIFLGVGEAYDENLVNNSHIVFSETKLLLDCGYSIPQHLWKSYPDKDFLDAVYFSHAHADHYMGIPVLLGRMQDEGRKKPLKIICQSEIRERIPHLIEYSHRNLSKKLQIPIEFIEIKEDTSIKLNELTLNFALTNHSVNNYAIKVQVGGKIVCYSGDGHFTDNSMQMYNGADLVIHEAFTLEYRKAGHACIKEVIDMCEEVDVKTLALTHLNRKLRSDKEAVLNYISNRAKRVHVILPEPLEDFVI